MVAQLAELRLLPPRVHFGDNHFLLVQQQEDLLLVDLEQVGHLTVPKQKPCVQLAIHAILMLLLSWSHICSHGVIKTTLGLCLDWICAEW